MSCFVFGVLVGDNLRGAQLYLHSAPRATRHREMKILGTRLIIIFTLIEKVFGQYRGCDYYQPLKPGVVYSIAPPKFPTLYTDCRWAAEAPAGYKVQLSCSQVRLPSSLLCNGDRLLVSRTGRADLRDAHKHCGAASFAETSSSTRMTMALRTRSVPSKGSFKCSLKALENNCSCGQLNSGRIGKFRECCFQPI